MSRRHKAASLIDKLFPLIKEITAAPFRIVSSPGKTLKSIFSISLYRNAIYLLSSTIVLSLTGFLFWIVAARFYSTESVGLASAAIAAMGLLAALSTLGLDFAIIGFWHNAGEKSRDMINSCMTVIVLASITVSIIFVVGLNFWSPALLTIREHPPFLFLFVMTVVATAAMTLNRQVFVAQRKAAFTLVQGLVFGLLRFVPLVLLATYFETFGIFSSWGIAVLLAVVIGVLILIPRVESSYYPRPIVRKNLIKDMVGFSFTNYSAQIATVLPQFVLPLLVVNLVGEKQNAYFYICWAIGNILFMIPTSVSMSLFAEGSHDKTKLKQEVKQCFKLIAYILGPAVLLLLLFGGKLLLLFGKPYSENGTHLLWVLALSAIPVSVNYIYFSMKRVEMQMRSVVLLSWIIAIATLIMSYFLLPHMGITWVGVAWLSINAIVAALISREFFKNPV